MRFLQEVLPSLGLRWAGFRQVRRQVRKRLRRRLEDLDLPDLTAYARVVEAEPAERQVLSALLRITISRFHRGIRAFELLRREVLPLTAEAARTAGEPLRCWSVGCASGEEPYTLALAWQLELAPAFPEVSLRVLATDADERMLHRARAADYAPGSLKELPPAWRPCFEPRGEALHLPERWRADVELRLADVRGPLPPERFRLILCRYLVFTYFAPEPQTEALARLLSVLEPGGFLVVAPRERLPALHRLEPWGDGRQGIYRRSAG